MIIKNLYKEYNNKIISLQKRKNKTCIKILSDIIKNKYSMKNK